MDDPNVIPTTNKGYKMLESMGWKAGEGLGTDNQGRKEPVATFLKRDRAGLGKKRLVMRVTHQIKSTESRPLPRKLTTEEKKQQKKARDECAKKAKIDADRKQHHYALELYGGNFEGYEDYF
ncbi:hypothetical protein LEN26_001155 [Aphanomyces euteiches]|nr:hypothetical protein AeMF1_003098 [Aphanomyces euteiches]KAH9162004.1 hypothetical protein LEN26_001155 [Aphanomyces euteiches]